jgi:hypothetical protein
VIVTMSLSCNIVIGLRPSYRVMLIYSQPTLELGFILLATRTV